jgi:hypothetical protein
MGVKAARDIGRLRRTLRYPVGCASGCRGSAESGGGERRREAHLFLRHSLPLRCCAEHAVGWWGGADGDGRRSRAVEGPG